MDNSLSESARFAVYREKLKGICEANNLSYVFIKNAYPIKLIIRPLGGVGEQMSMLEEATEDNYISPGASILFTVKDGNLTYRMSKTFTISDTLFNKINNIQRGSGGEISINFGYRGSVIPLRVFDTKVDRSGRVVTRVKKSSSRQALDHAFSAKMGSHYGIYERQGEKRFPVKELYGPATPQMMYSNESVMDSIEEKMASTYEERIEHEITRILNGWGV